MTPEQSELLGTLQQDSFSYFIHQANPANGLVRDKSREAWPAASIAAVGLALAAYPVGVERGFTKRDDAAQRTLTTLPFFATAPHGPGADATGHRASTITSSTSGGARGDPNCRAWTLPSCSPGCWPPPPTSSNRRRRKTKFAGSRTPCTARPIGNGCRTGGDGKPRLDARECVLPYRRHGYDEAPILDVVFNHTAEGNELGPPLCSAGWITRSSTPWLGNKRYYRDYTGTGNTIKANHPVVRDRILAALRYWMVEMHVDRFRFDLASVLDRCGTGRLLADAPLLERTAEAPILRDVKIVAEAWDAAGAYEVGGSSGWRWAEWNGRYRDDVWHFWRGDDGMLGMFASRICGSADIYTKSGPEGCINFVTCHDGFMLDDLVSFRDKHNEANGENNRDGTDANFSENCGAEGETTDAAIESIRKRQIENFLLTLLISRCVLTLLGGDEFRCTQGGNNNA